MKKNLLMPLLIALSNIAIAQVTQINSNKNLHIHFALDNNRGFFISEPDSTVWVTDGTSAGTIQLSSTIIYKGGGGIANGKFFFTATTAATGRELYISDGTPAGTVLLKDIYAGPIGSDPDDDFVMLNGFSYFSAVTEAEGRELWRTDGTTTGTTMVKDIVSGTEGSNTAGNFNIFSNGAYLLFSATIGGRGHELWKSDGTDVGTSFLKNINTVGEGSSNPNYFYKYNNLVFFMADDGTHGNEIWKTDGTDIGTVLLKDINLGSQSSVSAPYMHILNNKAYFVASDLVNGGELWSTDGTEANTVLVKDIMPGPIGSFATVYNAVNINNKFIFSAFSLDSGFELWESDGTTAGTNLFKDIIPGNSGGTPILLLAYDFSNGFYTHPLFQGNKFFLLATTDTTGYELWVSDGTADNTKMVKDIKPGSSNGISLTSLSYFYTTSAFYLAADDSLHGNELWKTDGTPANTSMIADINTGQPSADIQLGMIVNNNLIFQATNGDSDFKDVYRLDAEVAALPLKLYEFTAAQKNTDALLEWTTLTEVNGKDFTVQRSYDGMHFTTIGVIAAYGTSTEKHQYTFTDPGIFQSANSTVYYRLTMTDKDGKVENSRVIALKLKGVKEWTLKLLSNPVIADVELMLSGVTTNVTVSLKDLSGRLLNTRTLKANGQMRIPASNLKAGMYFLVAESDNSRKVFKFIKK